MRSSENGDYPQISQPATMEGGSVGNAREQGLREQVSELRSLNKRLQYTNLDLEQRLQQQAHRAWELQGSLTLLQEQHEVLDQYSRSCVHWAQTNARENEALHLILSSWRYRQADRIARLLRVVAGLGPVGRLARRIPRLLRRQKSVENNAA